MVACNHQRSFEYYLETLSIESQVSELAYACDSYESYKKGKCIECGTNNSDCAFFGKRSSEHQKSLADQSNEMGKRFYLITAPHPKYFR